VLRDTGPIRQVGRLTVPNGTHLVECAFHDAEHGFVCCFGVAALDCAGDVDVQLQGFVVGMPRHQPVVCAAGQHFSDEGIELGEHLIA
jgi:hypothetical protein